MSLCARASVHAQANARTRTHTHTHTNIKHVRAGAPYTLGSPARARLSVRRRPPSAAL